MTQFWIGVIVGMFIGANLGILLLGLLQAARESDDRDRKIYEGDLPPAHFNCRCADVLPPARDEGNGRFPPMRVCWTEDSLN